MGTKRTGCFSARLALLVLLGLVLAGCSGAYFWLDIFLITTDFDIGDVVIAMTVRDLSQPLTYNSEHMVQAADLEAEYSYGVMFDVDDDISTGDPEGFDVTLSVSLENGGNDMVQHDQTGVLADILPLFRVRPDRSILLSTYARDRRAALDGNTLYIGADTSEGIWHIPSGAGYIPFSDTFRARFFAYYNNSPDVATRVTDTVDLTGNGTATDPSNDVDPAVVDIIDVRISNLEPD